jgi:spore germination protein GerM
MDNRPHRENERIPPVMWLVLAAVISITALITVPIAVRSYRSSNLGEMVREYRENRNKVSSAKAPIYQASLYFLSPESNGTLSLHPYPYESDASSGLNGLLERLLEGPGLSELEDGSISLIPEHTRLIGTSIIEQAAYIELSKEFLDPGAFGQEGTALAGKQIARSAGSLPFISETVIIVDDQVISSHPDAGF